MKKLFQMGGLFAGCLLCTAISSNATLYSYDFSLSGFANGQSLENTTIGLATLTSETKELKYTKLYGGGLYNSYGADGDIYLMFSEAIHHIDITAGDGGGDVDAFAVTLYEFGSDELLGTWNSPVFGDKGQEQWFTLSLSAQNIGRVVFDPGNSGYLPGSVSGNGGVVLTELSYDTMPIPEPATLTLFGAGLAGILIRRRNKRQ